MNASNIITIESVTNKSYYLYSAERYYSGRISGYRIINGSFAGNFFKTKKELRKFAAAFDFALKRNEGNFSTYSV